MVINPDLLRGGVKIVQGGVIMYQIFDFSTLYVRKVHLDEFIRKCLRYSPGRSYLDIIEPNDIVYIVSLIKNSKDTWDQDIRMQELGAQTIGSQEKKLRPLFSSGSGQKRTQGKSLWNIKGMKYFQSAEKNGGRFMIVRKI
jgi:hypothetical protein